MAWMLIEELVKVATVWVATYLVKVTWSKVMEAKICMIPNCNALAARKGLCMKCYKKAKEKVDTNQTTWEALAEVGLCEREKDPFDDAYSRAMKDTH